MLLKKPKKRKSFRPVAKVGCAFCWQWIPRPERVAAHSLSGAWGGRCECGACFVVDDTGRFGGQALLDVLTLACDGDDRRALQLESGRDYEVRTKPLVERDPRRSRQQGPICGPQVWFVKLSTEPS